MKLPGKKTIQTFAMLPASVTFMLLGMNAAQGAYPDVILGDNPSAYYRLEETSGTTAVDSSVNGVNATYNINIAGTSPALGQPGIDSNSITFNGVGSLGDFGYIDIPASPLIAPLAPDNTDSGAFSEEMWVKVPNQPPTWQVPVEVAQYPNGWNIYVSGADAGNGAASWFYLDMRPSLFTSVQQITFLQWYHLVLTFDGTNAIMYVNGVAHGPYAASGFVPTPNSDAHIASGQGVGWTPLNGSVDEVAFYTNVLTAAQVLNHYQVGTNSFRAPPTPPSDLADPASTTIYSGLPVAFNISADGTQPLHYQWFENSAPVGNNSSTLSFTSRYPA
ncbi:MAG TPA: LamG domain-containing protein, partial [Verrucomicrobiae bacterium]|nr:LamG domain-containing protein [Verrucomicrobiae bacterium]